MPLSLSLCALVLLAMVQEAQLTEPQTGPWRAWLDSPGSPGSLSRGREIPFGLELEREGESWKAWIRNASERIEIRRVAVELGELVLHIDPYDSTIRARVSENGARLDGEWKRYRGPDQWTRMAFHATFGEAERFPAIEARAGKGSISGRWAVQFSEDENLSVGVFEEVPGTNRVEGTFLTTLGDYRYLGGDFDGKNLRLSVFDGAHAFLFKAELKKDGQLAGDFWSRDTWHETWTAERSDDAALPDPFELTKWNGRGTFAKLAFPDTEGEVRSLVDPVFAGKARLVVLFGTWCPNCYDETDYLVQLDRRFRDRGLSIVGLAFEFGDTFERNARVVREYAEHKAVEYPILLAGPADKKEASKAFPALDRVRAYPTTLFLDAKGDVRAIYTGFSGPATGPAHERLRERFEGLIEELLAE